MIVKCRICGKEFETKQKNFCLCSDECREKSIKIRQQEYRNSYKYEIKKERAKEKYRQRTKDKRYCKFCGSEVEKWKKTTTYCNRCYLNKLLIEKDKKEITRVKRILYCRGYDIEMINEELKQIKGETKNENKL